MIDLMVIAHEFAAQTLGVNLWLAPQLFVSSKLFLLAGLLMTGAVVIWYWRRLPTAAGRVRWWVVTLRLLVLLVVVLVISDLGVRYQAARSPQVILATIPAPGSPAGGGAPESDAVRKTIANLNRAGIETLQLLDDRELRPTDQPLPDRAILVSAGGVDPAAAESVVASLRRATGGGTVDLLFDLSDNVAPRVMLANATLIGPAFRGVPVKIACEVQARGMAGRESVVTVSDIAQIRSTAKINWTSDDETRTVSLDIVPKSAGWIDYTVTLSAPEGSQATGGQQIAAFVRERQWRVLLFEGEPSAESNFIRRSLEQAGLFQVEYFAQVSRNATVGNQSSDQPAPGTGASPTARLHALLADPLRLAQLDCIVIGPTPNSMLSIVEAERLRQWVDRRGGGLIFLGGNNFNGSVLAPNGRLTSVLPSTIDASSFPSPNAERGLGRPVEAESYPTYALVPTPAGADGALNGFVKALDRSADKRDVLGRSLQLGMPRAGGTVLAVSGDGQAATSDHGNALIAAMPFGSGRILLFAPADSFRLKVGESVPGTDGPFDALWRGLILWTSAGSQPASELSLSDDSSPAGREVVVEILARDAQFSPTTIERVSASWGPDGGGANGAAHNLTFLPDHERPNIWYARVKPSEVGKYLVQAAVTTAGGSISRLEQRFAVVPRSPIELGSTRDTLERLAQETGGQVYSLKGVDKLAARLKALPRSGELRTNTWRLRNFWPLAFMIPLLLAAEWLIHRLKL